MLFPTAPLFPLFSLAFFLLLLFLSLSWARYPANVFLVYSYLELSSVYSYCPTLPDNRIATTIIPAHGRPSRLLCRIVDGSNLIDFLNVKSCIKKK